MHSIYTQKRSTPHSRKQRWDKLFLGNYALRLFIYVTFIALLSGSIFGATITAQTAEPVLEPLPFSDVGAVTFFGGAVAMDGDTMVVGSTGTEVSPDDETSDLLGAAYIYTLDDTEEGDGWAQQAKLIPADFTEFNDQSGFGHSVAIDGNTVVIGASRNRLAGLRGGVYVFTGSGSNWSQQTRLTLADDVDGELLAGETVAISGDTIAVGVPDTSGGENEVGGLVYLFERSGTTWSLASTLFAVDEDGQPRDTFGSAVALDQDQLVVGDKHGADGFPRTRGSLHIYSKGENGWEFEAKLDNPEDEPSGGMGGSVALEGDVIVTGAEGEAVGDNILRGAIHIFIRYQVNRSEYQWRHVYRFTAPDGADLDNFGHSVSIKNRLIVAGAHQADTPGSENRGAAYVFAPVAGAWVNVLKLLAADGAEDDVLGSAVANNGEWVGIGAPHLDGFGSDSMGQTYVVRVDEFPEGKALYLPLIE